MKTLKNLTKGTLLLIATLVFTSCSNDDDNAAPQPLNIVETADAVPQLSRLVEAVQQAGLVDALSAAGDKTVLAPTNDAFTAFLAAKGFNSLADVPNDVLTQILLNHVIAGTNYQSSALIGNAGYEKTLADGPNNTKLSIYYNGTSGVQFNGGATVVIPDVATTNGIVHVIDQVIDIPTVVTFAAADAATFSTLVTALTTLTPATPFADVLSRTTGGNEDNLNPPFTVFAPTNAAFTALGTPPAEPTLTQVLLHHVVAGNITSSMLTPNGNTPAGTLQGDDLVIALPGTNGNIANVTDGSGNSDIGIIAVDVQAVNGVIHVFNKVAIPVLP